MDQELEVKLGGGFDAASTFEVRGAKSRPHYAAALFSFPGGLPLVPPRLERWASQGGTL